VDTQQLTDIGDMTYETPMLADPARPAGGLRGATRAELDTLEVDEWLEAFEWDVPGMICYLRRVAPTYYKGVPVGGILEKRQGAPLTLDEVRTRYGGGEFEISVYGPTQKEKGPRFGFISKRRVSIPGVPITDSDALNAEVRDAAGREYVAPPNGAADTLASLAAAQAEQLQDHARSQHDPAAIKEMRETYKDVMKTVNDTAEKRVEAKEAAVEERSKMMSELLNTEREERRRLQDQLALAEKEKQDMVAKVEERIKTAANEGSSLLAALLPTLSQNASDQIKMMAMQFEAKEQRLAAQHEMDTKNSHAIHQMQVQEMRASHESALRNQALLHDNNTTLLKGQIQNLEAEKAALNRQLDEARRQLDEARKELMATMMAAKAPSNPLEQVQQFGQLAEGMQMLRGVFGPPESAAPAEVGDDLENPMMRTGAKLLDKALSALPAITDAFKRGNQPQQPMMYAPQPQPQRQAMVPAAPPAPAPVAPPRTKIKRSDLVEALTFVDGVLAQGDGATSPQDLARSLSSVAPNDMIRELTRRSPENVLAQLEGAKLLTGRCATPEGREYLTKLLQALPRDEG